jgi:hypothetical protein
MARRLCAAAASFTLHVVAAVLVNRLAAPPVRNAPAAAGPRTMAVFAVPPADADAATPLGLKPIDRTDEDAIRMSEGSSTVTLPGFTFNTAKIRDRATLLFPFLTPGLSLERFALAPQREVADRFRDPFAPAITPQQRSGAARPRLALSSTALQSLIDATWSRRDRWTPFQRIVKLAHAYNADEGKLPSVLREYERQNGLQPYVDTSMRDPRLWTELGIAADHVEFIAFISRFASEHPSTKAATELLFLLDKLAQASMDALTTLLNAEPVDDLQWTRDANKDAYNLILDLRRYYAKQLRRKAGASKEGLTEHYDKVRLGILTGVLRTTPHGYRANDARFLIGAIYWRQGHVGDALRAWRQLTVEPTDSYATSISRLLETIEAQTGGDRGDVDTKQVMRTLTTQINSILRADHGRWIMFSMDRLLQFGFHFDTY